MLPAGPGRGRKTDQWLGLKPDHWSSQASLSATATATSSAAGSTTSSGSGRPGGAARSAARSAGWTAGTRSACTRSGSSRSGRVRRTRARLGGVSRICGVNRVRVPIPRRSAGLLGHRGGRPQAQPYRQVDKLFSFHSSYLTLGRPKKGLAAKPSDAPNQITGALPNSFPACDYRAAWAGQCRKAVDCS